MSYNQQQQHYGHQQAVVPIYAEHGEYADIDEPAVAETQPNIFPASHPLFTREEISNTRTLDPYPSTQSPQSWTPYEPPFRQQPLSYAPYPSPSPFPPPRLSPPPTALTQTFHFKAPGQSVSPGSSNHRLTLAGSLDPATGIFYRTPEHPRLRTAQACEKCRTRKAKCSGEHPSCKRCITRGLACEYAKEGRVRGPNKPKPKANATSTASPTSSTSTAASAAMNSETTPTSSKTGDYGARAGPHRSQSSHSSGGSSDETPMEASSHSLFLPTSPGGRDVQSSHSEYPYRQSVSNSPPLSSPSFSRGRRPGIDSGPIPSTTSRHSSLGEHPSPRSHLMDVHLEPASSLYRLSGAAIGDEGRSRLGSSSRDIRTSDIVPRMAVHSLPPDTHLYPYQHPLQPRDQQRDAPEHSYLSETIGSRPRQHQAYRYQHPDQPGQSFQTQRDLFSVQPADFPSAGTSQLHALSPVSIAQSRRMMSETGPGPAQGHHSFPPQSHIASHQQFVNQQPQQHNLVPIQLGLNIPGDHHPVRRQEHSGELAYPEPSAAGVSFFNAHGQHPQPGRGSESTTQEYHDEYQSHDPYRQHQAQHRQQQGFPDPNESQMAAAVHMHYAGHRPRTEFQMERAHLEESPASYPSRRTVSSTNSNRGGSPITPASAATSESEMLLYHYTATGGAPSCLDPDMHEMQPAGATTSLASVASVHSQPLGTQRPSPGGGEMHPNHTGVDVEDESRLGDIGAVQQRGNGHGGLSVSGSLPASLAANETEIIDHSPAGRGYGNEIQIPPESTGTEEDIFRPEHPGFPGAMQDMEFC